MQHLQRAQSLGRDFAERDKEDEDEGQSSSGLSDNYENDSNDDEQVVKPKAMQDSSVKGGNVITRQFSKVIQGFKSGNEASSSISALPYHTLVN